MLEVSNLEIKQREDQDKLRAYLYTALLALYICIVLLFTMYRDISGLSKLHESQANLIKSQKYGIDLLTKQNDTLKLNNRLLDELGK